MDNAKNETNRRKTWWLAALVALVQVVSAHAAHPERVLYARGEADAHRLEWKIGGEQPVVAFDFGGKTVGGYAVFKVRSFKPQGTNAAGRPVGFPVLRLAYATHPDGLSETGCFLRRMCAHYLGPTFDNPVLPANVNRFETYTISRTGTFVAPLIQGQERYVRVQLDTPGTSVELESLEILNVGVHAHDKPIGSFRCSDERINRSWDMSVWTCNIASFPNGDAWRVVAGRLLPRKLERGTEAGLCEKAELSGDGSWKVDFELRQNPHHDSAIGLMLHAADKDNGIVVVASQPAFVKVYRRAAGRMTELTKMVLDEPIVDGVPHRLEARARGSEVAVYFDGVKVISAACGPVAGGKFGIYVEKEWWPVVSSYAVADAKGSHVFADDFAAADAEGRLPGWDYTRAFKYLADGAKRDRLVWIGDLWWAERSCFYGFPVDWPYLRGALELLAWNQNPEGYIWAAPYAEIAARPKQGEFGHFPSDEFAAWFAPVLWDYYLYSCDRKTADTLYPSARRVLDYLLRHCREDGVFEQRIETSCHAGSMDPKDPRHRFFMNVVLWKALTDGARLARALGFADDAARWSVAAEKTAKGTRAAFWDPSTRLFRGSLEQPSPHAPGLSLALATGFASPDEALPLAVAIPSNGENKFHLLGMRGKFECGFDEAAFNMLEGGTWFQLSDPAWAGAQCCTECGFLTRNNWWDESHPDLTVAGVISTYLLGVEPVEPGYRVFRFAPHVVSRLRFAEGEVPTPHGMISARWARSGDEVRMTLTVPEGTSAVLALRLSNDIWVDGAKYDGRRLGPGRHEAVARGVTDSSFVDASLVAAGAARGQADDGWYVAPRAGSVNGTGSEFESVQTLDFGTLRDVQRVEIAAAGEAYFPAEIRVDVSADGLTFTQQAELTGLTWPGHGKTIEIDLRTVGSDLAARYVRLRCKRPPPTKGEHGDTFYCVRFSKVRVKYR